MSRLSAMTGAEITFFILFVLFAVEHLIASIFCFAKPGRRFLWLDPTKRPGDPKENSLKEGFIQLGLFISMSILALEVYFDFQWNGLVTMFLFIAPLAVLMTAYRLIRKLKNKAAKAEEA